MPARIFDYVVDIEHSIIKQGAAADQFLDKLCPVMVGAARAKLRTESNAALFLGFVQLASFAVLNKLFARQIDSVEQVLLAASASELAKRYIDGTLEPQYHTVSSETITFAREAFERRMEAQADHTVAVANEATGG